MVENQRVFLKIMLNLESYFIEFDSTKNIKNKVYIDNYQVRVIGCRSEIVIMYNEYISSTT